MEKETQSKKLKLIHVNEETESILKPVAKEKKLSLKAFMEQIIEDAAKRQKAKAVK